MDTAVPYLRVSTDDRGQDPERQLEIIRPWAEREGIALLDSVIDEGTSASKTNPFERPRFVEACERARTAGAVAIVVECSDRFSRQGSKRDAWAEVELEIRFGLKLFRADKPLSAHGTIGGNFSDTANAEASAAWVKAHSAKVKSGMAKAKREGQNVGRPPKPFTDTERDQIATMRAAGAGWRKIALAISRARGAFEVADPSRRKQLCVSHMHVKRALSVTISAP